MNVTPLKPRTEASEQQRIIPALSIETNLIVEKIATNRANTQTFTYGELSTLIGRDILANRGFLYSAKRILFRDHGVLLETVKNVGVRIATNSGVLNAGVRDVGSSRRALRRASRKFEAVEYSALPDEEKKTYVGQVSIVNALQLLTKPSIAKKVADQGGSEPLPSAKVLELFSK